ncbi:hypothetical protein MmiHf6_15070 [Methanimicrococcus hongohii]|uniref:Transcription regulator TrmB N-terminal domain-containing protein n=1 Tax=Methanimicrococcus hongohii TaxID=3028295 RepID=A0AA96V1J3_9EURY|nr:helix-turn-helix domain-containing protein [Methanimicrococcus sp. Hf6]WNY24178.1 hypothetical protein MmiHf6_15070 [Methanimicrococcus sp. Hf6]
MMTLSGKSGELIFNLKKLGLSENEAKAYIALVFRKESSAREIHEFTDIPRAKVYEVLEGLVEKRYAVVLQGTPVHYQPTEPEELILMLREEFESISTNILKQFEEIEYRHAEDDPNPETNIQYLRSEFTIRKKVNELLDESRKNIIILSRSPAALKKIESDLISVKKRLNLLILVDDEKDYENFSLPVMQYPESVQSILKELEDSHLTNQSCFIITDVKRAIAIGSDENKMEAHVITQSVIDFLFKTIYYFIINADNIVLPEEFSQSESKPAAKSAKKTSTKKPCCRTTKNIS